MPHTVAKDDSGICQSERDKEISKILRDRYGRREGLMLEVGGYNYTIVSDSIQLENKTLIELDRSETGLYTQKLRTSKRRTGMAYILSSARTDFFRKSASGWVKREHCLPLKDSAMDAIFLFGFPMYGQSDDEMSRLFYDFYRVLKDDGEIIICPNFEDHDFLYRMFNVVIDEPYLLVLGKKARG